MKNQHERIKHPPLQLELKNIVWKALLKLQAYLFHVRNLQAQLTMTFLSMTPSCISRVL